MEFIKSNSDYVHRAKHSETKDGTIYERDITTLGGLNLFSSTQVPIYTSGNFIISVDGTTPVKRKIEKLSWEANGDSDVWTLDTMDTSSAVTDSSSDDSNIVLRKDFYRLQDFAYYGSLSELIKSSLTDIINRFPGELYTPTASTGVGYVVHFTANTDGEFAEYILGESAIGEGGKIVPVEGGFIYLVSNPFSLNFHINNPISTIENPQKYFFLGDNKNYYEVIDCNGDSHPCSAMTITCVSHPTQEEIAILEDEFDEELYGLNIGLCKGDCVCEVSFVENGKEIFAFNGYLGDNNVVYYLTSSLFLDYHVRPVKEVFDTFMDECNIFETYLLSKKESISSDNVFYTSTFEILKETEQGYIKTLEDFLIPVDYSGYNLDIISPAYTKYVSAFADIAEYYDEHFTDNLWRSMTHESIKNFDWTYTREYIKGEEEEYIIGGTRISNIIHLFGREFDEVKNYIDYIKYINVLTYDGRNNLPDYFLTDLAETKGWDLVNICPFTLIEYTESGDNKTYVEVATSANTIGDEKLYRQFSQNTESLFSGDTYNTIQPYRINSCLPYGTFIYCDDNNATAETINDSAARRLYHSSQGSYQRIMPYYSKAEYSTTDAYNAFLKRLSLNSPSIFTHKGTIEGIEEILALFGMKSQRWCDSITNHPQQSRGCDGVNLTYNDYYIADYTIKEYTTFTHGLFDTYNDDKQTTWINWYNSTKMMPHMQNDEYEGLPVSFESVYTDKDGNIVSADKYNNMPTSGQAECTFFGNKLYPYFGDTIDGDPYYQMYGGWLAKDEFTFDKNNNIVIEGSSEDDVRDRTLFTETHCHFRAVTDISGITEFVSSAMTEGDVLYVENFKNEYVIVDGYEFYPLHNERLKVLDEWYEDKSGNKISIDEYSWLDYDKQTGYTFHSENAYKNFKYFDYTAKIGSCTFGDITFSDDLYFSNPLYWQYGDTQHVGLNDITSDQDVRVYLSGSVESGLSFVMSDGTYQVGNDHIMYFMYDNGKYRFISYDEKTPIPSGKTFTNYFILHDKDNCNFYDFEYGWEQLADDDVRYWRLNTIIEKSKGNNPHCGHSKYDMGNEYMEYFNFLFKHVLENDLINDDCFRDNNTEEHKAIMSEIGFNKLMTLGSGSTDINKEYGYLEAEDSKIHTFCDMIINDFDSSQIPTNSRFFREQTGNLCYGITHKKYEKDYHLTDVNRLTNMLSGKTEEFYGYGANDIDSVQNIQGNDIVVGLTSGDSIIIDDVEYSGFTSDDTDQIMNTKRVDIIFNMYTKEEDKFSIKGLEERKYIESVILPYLEQMLPSNIICKIRYDYNYRYEKSE